MQIEIETFVAAPPPVVFETLADFANWPHFMGGIERVEILTPGPVAVGSRFRETRTMFGKSASEEMEVAEIAPPHRIELTAHNHGTDYRIAHTLAAAPEGTRLSLRFAGTPVTLAARLFAPLGWLFAGSVRKQIEKDLVDLKREAECRHGAAI
jgi:uncharacterized protein YndB with AHSA1/START domain